MLTYQLWCDFIRKISVFVWQIYSSLRTIRSQMGNNGLKCVVWMENVKICHWFRMETVTTYLNFVFSLSQGKGAKIEKKIVTLQISANSILERKITISHNFSLRSRIWLKTQNFTKNFSSFQMTLVSFQADLKILFLYLLKN